MIRILRPTFGQINISGSVLAAVLFGVTGCQKPNESNPDTWSLNQPTLDFATPQGLRFTVKSSDTKLMTDAQANEESALSFAEKDRGLKLEYEANCTESGIVKPGTANTTSNAITSKGQTETSESVPILSLTPVELLRPSHVEKPWLCRFKFRAFAATGSSHSFKLGPITLKVSLQQPLSTLDSVQVNTRLDTKSNLTIHCENWWSSETSTTSNASALTSDAELNLAQRIGRILSRETANRQVGLAKERKPTCLVLERTNTHIKPRGLITPTLGVPKFDVQRTVLIPKAAVYSLFRTSILRWKLTNDEDISQIYFLRTPGDALGLKLAVLLTGQGRSGWTKLLSSPTEISVLPENQNVEQKIVPGGTYLRLPARAHANIELKLNRMVSCDIDFTTQYTSRVAIKTAVPLQIESLANTPTNSLASLTAENLSAIARDQMNTKNILLHELVIHSSPDNAQLFESNHSVSDAMAGQPLLGTHACVQGPHMVWGSPPVLE